MKCTFSRLDMGLSEMGPSGSNASSPIFSWLVTLKPKGGCQESCDAPHSQKRNQAQGGKPKLGILWQDNSRAGSRLRPCYPELTWPVILEDRFSFMEEMSLLPLSLRLGLCGRKQFLRERVPGQHCDAAADPTVT